MKLILDEAKCTGCKLCELACSAKHQGVFNPRKTHLRIRDHYTQTGREKSFESCTLCLTCVQNCPVGAIGYNGRWLTLDNSLCTGCRQCIEVCSQGVIYLGPDNKAAVPDFCEGKPFCIEWCPHQAIRQEG